MDKVPLEVEVPLAEVDRDSPDLKASLISLEERKEAQAVKVLSATFLMSSRRCSAATRKEVEEQKLRLRARTS